MTEYWLHKVVLGSTIDILCCKICYTSALYVFVLLGTTPSSYNPCAINFTVFKNELGHGMRMRVKFRSGPERMFWDFEWKLDELKYNHLSS